MIFSTPKLPLCLSALLLATFAACDDTNTSNDIPDAANQEGRPDSGSVDATAPPTDADLDDAAAGDGGLDAEAEDAGAEDAGVEDASAEDASVPTAGWQERSDVIDGIRGARTAMHVSHDGRALLAFRDDTVGQALRVVRWHGADTGAWDDLGIANVGVAGVLETAGDPQARFVGLAFATTTHVVVAFRQNGAVYANVHDGNAWKTPFVVSTDPSAVAVAGDVSSHAVVAYRASTSSVQARTYDAASDTWGTAAELAITPDEAFDDTDAFWIEAAMNRHGNALVAFRGRKVPQLGTHDIYTARYEAQGGTWQREDLGALVGSTQPQQLCLALNADGVAVLSLRESFTNQFGTFARTRAAHRAEFTTPWNTWQILNGPSFHDSCALAEDGTALVTTLVAGTLDSITPHRFAAGTWTTGSAIDTRSTTGPSRFVPALAADGTGAGVYFRNDNEVRIHRFTPSDGWTGSESWNQVHAIDTANDLFFKGGALVGGGRYLWVYQEANGRLRYVVHR